MLTPEPSARKAALTDRDVKQITLAIDNPKILQHYATALFRRSDMNRDGVLSFDELQRLIPTLHRELGLALLETPAERDRLVRQRMRKFNKNGDGVLSESEFFELYRYCLLMKFEDLNPPKFRRGDVIGCAHKGTPNQFYQIGEHLGAGQFGIVHQVTQRQTGIERVMKTINKEKANQTGTPLAMLHMEIDLLAMLDHPHILRLFEWYNDTQNIYIIMDVCRGGELLDLVTTSSEEQWGLPEAWVARIMGQALEAIAYCHGKGVMHKDLKFENVMLEKKVARTSALADINVMIIDVGLAELFGAQHGKQSRSSLIAGSPATMAPEVLMGDFSYKCDIWGLGCMLFAVYNVEPFFIPDGKGGQSLYMYPFAPVPTEADPIGTKGLLKSQAAGPPMEQLHPAVSSGMRELAWRMLQYDERARPTAQECLGSLWLSDGAVGGGSTCLSREELGALLKEREMRVWWRATTVQAASQLPASKIEPLSRRFASMDLNKDGCVDRAELSTALERLGVPREMAERAAEAADIDCDGKIEWSEFVATCLPASRELFAVSLQIAFQNFDKNADGFLDANEVSELLQSGHIESVHMPASKTVQAMVADLDRDHNGRISFAEFHDYFIHADSVTFEA